MSQQNEILNSKISVPGTDGTIVRERLTPFFSAILENKVTVITAGTGYGKSTIVAQAIGHNDCDFSWYRLELSDVDPVTFIHYIIAGIRKTYLEFGNRTLNALNSALPASRVNKAVLSVLINEIESTVNGDFIMVFDDCHEVLDNTEIAGALEFLIDHLPQKIHIVMTSRIESAISLSRFRASLEINEILQTDLEFTPNEVVALYNQLFGFLLQEESLNNLLKQTEGWVSGLILFYHLSKGGSLHEIEQLLTKIKSNHKIFKEYMGENVYEQQSDDIKSFLLKTSILTHIDSEFCNRLLGRDDSGPILDTLVKQHLFTSIIDEKGKIYCYHLILQEFLAGRLEQEMGKAFVQEAHNNAAVLYEKSDRDEDALHHYLCGCNYSSFFRLLRSVGHKYIIQGRRKALGQLLEKIPETFFQTEPWPLALKAKLLTSEGQLVKSARISKKAYDIFIERKMLVDADLTLMDLGKTYCLMGNFNKAEDNFVKVLDSGAVDSVSYLEILGNLIFISSFKGEFNTSDAYYNSAIEKLELLKSSENPNENLAVRIMIVINYGFRWLFSGNFVKSSLYADSVYDDIKTLNSSPALALYYQLTSINYFFLGNIDKAIRHNNKGLRQVKGKGFHGTQEAWLRLSLSAIYLITGNYDAASIEISKGIDKFRSGGSKWGEASMMLILAAINYKTGEITKARKLIADGLTITHDINMPWVEGKFLYYSAIDKILQKEFQEADSLLNRAERLLDFSLHERCMLLNIRTKFYSLQGQEEKALDSLKEALALGEKYMFGTWMFVETDTDVLLFLKIYAEGNFKSYLTNIITDYWQIYSTPVNSYLNSPDKQITMVASEIIMKMPESGAPDLGVCCLGRFRVFVGDREIDSSEWKSNKAKEIFKYLVMGRAKNHVHKDVLLELIWPDQDYEKTLKRLHVALPAMRKALEPDVKKGESAYLVRENDNYRINYGLGGFVDVDLFEESINMADNEPDRNKRLSHLLQAESYYKGDFLEEDLYLEWCFEERENLKHKYLNALDKIIDIYESVNDIENAIRYSEKYLEIDNYSEEKYKKLMQYYFDSGNFSMGLKTYDKCYEKVVQELDCPLSNETGRIYEKLIKTKKFITSVYK